LGALGLLIVAVAVVAMHSMHVAHGVDHAVAQTASVLSHAGLAVGLEAEGAECHAGCASSPMQEGSANSFTVVCLAVLSTLALLSLLKLPLRPASRIVHPWSLLSTAAPRSPVRRLAPTVIQVGVLRT
jgi:hypothetical protein